METINISTAIGSVNGTETEDGQKIYDLISNAIDNDSEITLSFQDIETLTPEFLEAAIGKLYGNYPKEVIKSHLHIVDISVSGKVVLKRVVNMAKQM